MHHPFSQKQRDQLTLAQLRKGQTKRALGVIIAPFDPVEPDRSVKLIAHLLEDAADRAGIDFKWHRERLIKLYLTRP
jgi:hypothetical protein